MLPVGEFNFMVGGIATIAASVGYAFSRRLIGDPRNTADNAPDHQERTANRITDAQNPTPDADSSVADKEPTFLMDDSLTTSTSTGNIADNVQISTTTPHVLTRKSSLKRKRPTDDNDDTPPDAGYPHNLASIYPPPKKRSRTPSSDEKDDLNDAAIAPEEPSPDTIPASDSAVENEASPITSSEPNFSAEVSLPSPPRTPNHSPRKHSEPLPATQTPIFGAPMPMQSTPRTPPSRRATANAFSAFSGTASPFASFSAASPSKNIKPAWTLQENSASGSSVLVSDQESASKEGNLASTTDSSPKHELALEAVLSSKSTVEYLTGEEDEDVELELKGVKLYVKRGDNAYSEGVIGHVKLLSHRTTLDERLLFRREPLWKVSMNVRMNPTVRCTHEAEENIVRLVHQELVEQANVPQEDWRKEIVVYAMKPGRSCSKQDFKDFATSLVECPGLKPR